MSYKTLNQRKKMSFSEIMNLPIAVLGIGLTIVLSLVSPEWRTEHKKIVLVGQMFGLFCIAFALYVFTISFVPFSWEPSMIAKASIIIGAALFLGGMFFELMPDGHAQSPSSASSANQVGNNSTVIGTVPPGGVGNDSTIVNETDSNGNTILRSPMAVGAGACAGPGSIAIGAGAGANGCLPQSPLTPPAKTSP